MKLNTKQPRRARNSANLDDLHGVVILDKREFIPYSITTNGYLALYGAEGGQYWGVLGADKETVGIYYGDMYIGKGKKVAYLEVDQKRYEFFRKYGIAPKKEAFKREIIQFAAKPHLLQRFIDVEHMTTPRPSYRMTVASGTAQINSILAKMGNYNLNRDLQNYVTILPADVYRGKCTNNPEDCDGDPNATGLMVIGAKFMGDRVALWRMIVLMSAVIKRSCDYDLIIPVNNRDTNYHLAAELAKGISKRTGITYADPIYDSNTKCRKLVEGKRVLVIDDVIYSGRTLMLSTAAVRGAGAAHVSFLAFGKSRKHKL